MRKQRTKACGGPFGLRHACTGYPWHIRKNHATEQETDQAGSDMLPNNVNETPSINKIIWKFYISVKPTLIYPYQHLHTNSACSYDNALKTELADLKINKDITNVTLTYIHAILTLMKARTCCLCNATIDEVTPHCRQTRHLPIQEYHH